MNSKERHEKRYWRRKRKREIKEYAKSKQYTNFDDIFGYLPMAEALKRSRSCISYKPSVGYYRLDSFRNIARERSKIKRDRWESSGFNEFTILERGKIRHIQAPTFHEKVVQRTFCDNSIIPILQNKLIYDNAATIKGRGTDFLIRRLTKQLRHHFQLYGRSGYIFFFDFHDYFNSISHYRLKNNVDRIIYSNKIREFYHLLIDSFKGLFGLGLGSQVSQISAVFYPNKLDHFIKDRASIHGYGRYNDDGYVICKTLQEAKYVKEKFYEIIRTLQIVPNKKKCRIVRISDPFTFLKRRIVLTASGAVIIRMSRKAITKERHRLKKYKSLVLKGVLSFDEVSLSFHSWLCTISKYKSSHVIVNLISYFNRIFHGIGSYTPRSPKYARQRKRYREIAYAYRLTL